MRTRKRGIEADRAAGCVCVCVCTRGGWVGVCVCMGFGWSIKQLGVLNNYLELK